jgi:DNA-binding transcriptional ArsR family regulator
MRTPSILDALMPPTRQKVLSATMLAPEHWWYLSDLARHIGVPPSSLQREMAALTAAGILVRRQDGNRSYYRPDTACPVIPDLAGLIEKTVGIAHVVRESLGKLLDRIDCAFVFGSVARGRVASGSDVDLMVIGRVGLNEVAPALRVAEARTGRPINAAVYTGEELAAEASERSHFVTTVLAQPKLFIKGDMNDLAGLAGSAACAAP